MDKNRTRLTAIAGTTMALVLAGTAAVSAAGPRDRDDFGFGGRMGSGNMMDDWGRGGFGGLWGVDSDIERTERTVQTADGVTVSRVEQGVADSASDTGLSFSLASGEAVTVAVDEDTEIYAYEEQEVTGRGGWSRTRLAPTEVELADVAAGSEIVVWSDSEDGADFVASRILIQPAEDAEDAADADADDAAAADEDTTEDAATTDA